MILEVLLKIEFNNVEWAMPVTIIRCRSRWACVAAQTEPAALAMKASVLHR